MVMVSAMGIFHPMYETIGMFELPSFMPGIIACHRWQSSDGYDISEALTPYSDEMTFLERLTNFKVNFQIKLHMRQWHHVFWGVFNAKYPGFPPIQEIYNVRCRHYVFLYLLKSCRFPYRRKLA